MLKKLYNFSSSRNKKNELEKYRRKHKEEEKEKEKNMKNRKGRKQESWKAILSSHTFNHHRRM